MISRTASVSFAIAVSLIMTGLVASFVLVAVYGFDGHPPLLVNITMVCLVGGSVLAGVIGLIAEFRA